MSKSNQPAYTSKTFGSESKTYGTQRPTETTPGLPGGGSSSGGASGAGGATTPNTGSAALGASKQQVLDAFEGLIDTLVNTVCTRVGGAGGTGGGSGGSMSGGSGTGIPSGAGGATSGGSGSSGSGGYAGGDNSGSGVAGSGAVGAGSQGSTGSGSSATGGTIEKPSEPSSKPNKSGSVGSEASANGLSLTAQREQYRLDRNREAAKAASKRESGSLNGIAKTPTKLAAAPESQLLHTSVSSRGPSVTAREFGPAFGALGRPKIATMEKATLEPKSNRPESVPAPGGVAGGPLLDAYWASYGTALERVAIRSTVVQKQLEVVLGVDSRVRVRNTQAYPWCCICSLIISAPDGTQWVGTGWLVSPRLVLTAGHCVFMKDHGGWATSIEVIPGRDGTSRPFGSASSGDVRSVIGWTENEDESDRSNYDYGAIILPADKRYGDQLGWFGFAARDEAHLRNVTLNLSGYPADGGNTTVGQETGTQWYDNRAVKDVFERQITYEIDTFGGQSGSPVWEMTSDGNRYGVGIHTFGDITNNGATRITQQVFDRIAEWVGEAT